MRIILEIIFEILLMCVNLSGVELFVAINSPHFKRTHQFRVHMLNSENPNNAKLTPGPLQISYSRVIVSGEKDSPSYFEPLLSHA